MAKKAVIITISILTSLVVASAITVAAIDGTSYRADETAKALLNDSHVTSVDGGYLVKGDSVTNKCIVFYPGAKVESVAYLPLMRKINEYNIDCYIVTMPLNFAIMNENAADNVISDLKDYSHYYIMGHSLGGSIASAYSSKHQNKIDGLILLGSYPYREYPLENTLTIYGSLNTGVEEKIDYSTNVVRIEGGNHCYFGNYGMQKGDKVGTISREVQQDITASSINLFINA